MPTATEGYAPPSAEVQRDDSGLERATTRRVSLRLLPIVFLLFVFNYVDRNNVAIAALEMNRDLRFSATAYGFGAGIFFIGYALFEVPSNLILARVGARRWIARIVISWGLIASAMMFVRTPLHFYLLRALLGLAEAGFFPGIVYYLSLWFPAAQRARALSRFITAVPLSAMIGNPLGGWLLGFDGTLGLRGWQWVFLVEGIPSVLLGLVTLRFLTDRPEQARWLSAEQRDWLVARLRRDEDASAAPHGLPGLRALAHPVVWLACTMYFLYGMTFYGYTFWAPLIVRETLGVDAVATGLITGLMACLAVVAMLAVGASSDRTGERFLHMTAGLGLVIVGYLGAALMPSPIGRVIGLALVLAGDMSFVVPFWCLPSTLLRGAAAAAGIALVNAIGNLGGFFAPYLVGRVRDATGGSTTAAFLALAACAFVSGVMVLVLRRRAA
jgi:sugar phosphate permease